mgnify:CR=1 FL=1
MNSNCVPNKKNIEKVNVFGGTKKTYNNYSKSTYNKDDGFAKYNTKRSSEKKEDYSFKSTTQQTKINSSNKSVDTPQKCNSPKIAWKWLQTWAEFPTEGNPVSKI